MNNIVLIGMPGAGKSTVGVVLAKRLGYHFMDSDLLIQEREGRLLHEIIEQEGDEGFLAIENDVNRSLQLERTVIATGGSAVYGKEAMEHLGKIGTIVYLKISYEELQRRLGNLKDRGVVLREGQDLRGLYDEKTPLYERYADMVIEQDGKTIEETSRMITDRFR